ncbi:polyamine aminopropyltransferase [Pilimelia anulata]|uniref:Polyamine aminopropyltransferase n=1 Tax=Pilimelia anulata TaxID=53371 RepID=A0A8J3BEG5_9ACTN|nr:polyamine aminopropyltransferase [Pilimelia anulata]GGK02714.1 polyamine aminopropyltransferase [Pilimelia anulata]
MEDGPVHWFTESALPYASPGVRVQVAYTAVRHDERTPYGHVQVLDTPFHGRVLVLDGIIQTTERDEAIYHEMLVLPPALQHGAPRDILIVGGGDGGALRRALRLRSLRRVVQVEIDETVTRVCREHLPAIGGDAWDDPRVELVFADGAAYVADGGPAFDVIVLDLPDPIPGGPAEPLFGADFLAAAARRLAPGGVLALQCGSLTVQPAEVARTRAAAGRVFADTLLHHAVIPGYQLTSFGFLVAAAHPLRPAAAVAAGDWSNIDGVSEHLTPEVYAASTVLPPHLARRLATA